MIHILVHLVKEIDILGTVYLHNMFPFKRFMVVLKKEALPVAMEQRRSLSFVLTLLMTLNRLWFLNHSMRREYVEKAH
jgi:hypothetical protein